jgi:hypothetical protein
MSFLSHTDYEDIDNEKLYLNSKKTLQMKHPVFKKHELIFKTPVFKLGKFPFQTYKIFDPTDNRINLQFDMGPEYKEHPFYQFYQTKIQSWAISNISGPLVQKSIDNKFKLKLSHMEKFDYPVYEVSVNETSYKPYIKQHKPTTKDELEELFKQNYMMAGFVQFKIYRTNSVNYLVMKPIKIYVGKKLDEQIMSQIIINYSKQSIPQVPQGNYYDPTPKTFDITDELFSSILDS